MCLNVYRVYEEDHDECMRQCQSLLDEPNLETAVRLGDVYGLMIEHYGQVGNYDQVLHVHIHVYYSFQ